MIGWNSNLGDAMIKSGQDALMAELPAQIEISPGESLTDTLRGKFYV